MVHALKRGRKEEMKVVRLMGKGCLLPEYGKVCTLMLPRAMSWSVVQLQLGVWLKSVAHVVTRAHTETWDRGSRLQPCWSLGTLSQQGSTDLGGPLLPYRVMCLPGPVCCQGPCLSSRLYSGQGLDGCMWLLFAAEGHEDTQGQVSHLSPGLCPRTMVHADLSLLHCHLMLSDIWARAAAEDLVWISGPMQWWSMLRFVTHVTCGGA